MAATMTDPDFICGCIEGKGRWWNEELGFEAGTFFHLSTFSSHVAMMSLQNPESNSHRKR